RKLLLHRGEIARLLGRVMEKGLTLVPLRLYFKEGRVKVELGLARGRKTLDKRHAIREREERREMDRALRERARRLHGSATRTGQKGAMGLDGDHEVQGSISRAPIPSSNGGSAIAADTELALAA